ncbi:MAG: glycosyltransferase family 39 protein [Anaerolineales bacterium]|nr:glycosyltransferase family 39 protein [Anaerolineales bacterium]
MFSILDFTNERFNKIRLISLLFLAFIVRMAAIFLAGDTQLDHEYATLVPNLLNGRGFSYYSVTQTGLVTNEYILDPKIVLPTAFKPPIYSLLIAGLGLLFGIDSTGILIIEILQAGLGAYTCLLIYEIAKIKFNLQTAVWSFLIAGVFPLLAYTSAQISDATLQIFLRVFFFWLLFKLEIQPESKKLTVLASLSLGILITARTEMLLYIPFIALWMIWVFKDKWLRLFAQIMTLSILIVAPWVIRNYIQFNVITLNTSGGLNLWEGQNEQAKGIPSWYTDPSAELSEAATTRVENLAHTRDYEIKLDEIYYDEAKEFIRSHPDQALKLALRKFVYYWLEIYPGINFIYTNADSPFYWLPWLLILPFFITGLILNLKSFRQHFLFYTSFLLSTLTVMIFFVLPKYIVFVIPWVFIFAASSISLIAGKISRKVFGRSTPINA